MLKVASLSTRQWQMRLKTLEISVPEWLIHPELLVLVVPATNYRLVSTSLLKATFVQFSAHFFNITDTKVHLCSFISQLSSNFHHPERKQKTSFTSQIFFNILGHTKSGPPLSRCSLFFLGLLATPNVLWTNLVVWSDFSDLLTLDTCSTCSWVYAPLLHKHWSQLERWFQKTKWPGLFVTLLMHKDHCNYTLPSH